MEEGKIDLSVNFNNYKVFYIVAKNLNITKAAQELFISQPAVTQTINKLEQELNQKLFVRNNKGLRLTSFGNEIFLRVENGILSLSQIKQDSQNFGSLNQGSLVIGAGTHITKAVLAKPLAKFKKQFPNITIAIKDNKKEVMLQMLSVGEIDLFLSNNLCLDNEKFDFVKLFTDKRVFVASKEFLQQNKSLKFVDIANNNLITLSKGSSSRQDLEEIAKKQKLQIFSKLEVEGYSSVINMVSFGFGVGFLPEFLVKDEIENKQFFVIDVGIKIPSTDYGIILNKNHLTKAASVFVEMIEKE